MHLTPNTYLALLAAGCAIGVLSGMLGIGGGVLVIPALTFLFGFTQQMAVGTSVGMLLPPIGVFAFVRFYKAGQVDLPAAGLLATGFALGAYVGAVLVTRQLVPAHALRLLFAFFLLYIAGNLLFRSEARVAAALYTLLATAALMLAYAASFFALRLLGKRWERRLSLEETYRQRLARPLPPDYEI